jgi:hypothetical protein
LLGILLAALTLTPVAGQAQRADSRAPRSDAVRQIELHSLTAWDAPEDSDSVYVSFTPISMQEFYESATFVRKVLAGEEIEVADCEPELSAAHVSVSVDSIEASVLSLDWYYAGYGDLTGTDTRYMPVCVIRIRRPRLSEGEHALSVHVRDVVSGADGRGGTTFVSRRPSERL